MSAQIVADASWWKRAVKALTLSCETSHESGASMSFLSCIYVEVYEGELSLSCESGMSTTYVHVDADDPEVEAEGTEGVLIPANTLSGYLSQMPDEVITLEIDSESEEFTVLAEQSDIMFRSSLVEMESDDAIPRATKEFPDDAFIMEIDSKEFTSAYRAGSVMVRPADSDALAGQDPLSGSVVTIDEDGAIIFSMAVSASERCIDGKVEGYDEDSDDEVTERRCLTWPAPTIARLAVLDGLIKVGVGSSRRFAIADRHIHIDSAALSIGTRSDSVSMKTVSKVLIPAWDASVVQVKTPSKEFFSALGRAGSLKADRVSLEVDETSIILTTSGGFSFRQTLACSTQWFRDDLKEVKVGVDIGTVRKLAALISRNESLTFNIAYSGNRPWALIVHEDDYDPKDPHNFFMLALSST